MKKFIPHIKASFPFHGKYERTAMGILVRAEGPSGDSPGWSESASEGLGMTDDLFAGL